MTISRFVDAHVHLWQLELLSYPWLTPPFADDGPNGSVEAIAKTYLLADYFDDADGYPVEKIVHVEAGAHPKDALSETRWLQGLASRTRFPQAIVAYAPLNEPDVESLLAQHVENANVRGIRQIINWHPDPKKTYTAKNALYDPAFTRGFGLLSKYRLSFDLQLYPNQMTDAFRLIRAHEDTQVIINHAGMPIDRDGASIAQWRAGLELLASLPNVAIKISGMGFVDRHFTATSIRPVVLDVIERFGTDRCAFASDVPTDNLFNTYGHTLNAFDEIIAGFSDSERLALFATNAERLYRI